MIRFTSLEAGLLYMLFLSIENNPVSFDVPDNTLLDDKEVRAMLNASNYVKYRFDPLPA